MVKHMQTVPSEILAKSPMGRLQIFAVILCVMLNALDGFDVLSISFAAPGIASEWGITRGQLGIVLSMELIGMGVGSITLGRLADKVGRRPMILGCLILMCIGMFLVSTSKGLTDLSVYRFMTGVGIGGLITSINTMVAEYSNARRRALCVILVGAGFPIGAIIGGSIASTLLVSYDWRSVFLLGAGMTGMFIPVVWFLLPESIEFLAEKRPKNALKRINATLSRMGHNRIDVLPALSKKAGSGGLGDLFRKHMVVITLVLTTAYFMHIATFYFILKWIPKIVVDMGNPASLAGSVLVWANVGGVMGSILLGMLSQKMNIKWLVLAAFIASFVMVAYFGQGQSSLKELAIVAACAGFFTNAGVVGLYALFVMYFPTRIRATGTGFVIGVGRAGSALSPILAGFMFQSGVELSTVALIMASGSLIAGAAILLLRPTKASSEHGASLKS